MGKRKKYVVQLSILFYCNGSVFTQYCFECTWIILVIKFAAVVLSQYYVDVMWVWGHCTLHGVSVPKFNHSKIYHHRPCR